MDERLRLLAELKDNMSSGLKKINTEMKQTKRTPGMEQAQKWFEGFSATTKEASKAGGTLSGVLGAVGVGGLSAAASMAVLAKQFKDLGDHIFTMKRLGQETGMTIDQVKRWEYVGQAFRVPVEQMDGALKALGDKMVDFRRRRGELFGQMNQIAPEEASKLLGLKDADAQFGEIMRWLSTIKDTALRNRWAREFFGTDDLGALLTNGLPELERAMKEARARVAPISPEMQQRADQLAKSIADLNAAWGNFETTIGPAFLGMMTKLVDKATLLFGGATPDEKAAFDKKDEDRRRAFEAAKKQHDDETSVRQRNGGAKGERFSDDDWKIIEKGLAHRSSYSGSGGGLLHMAAFGGGGGSGAGSFGIEATIASGTKIGVLAAFREWAAERSAGDTGGGAGVISASYETSAGGTGGGGRRGGGRSGGVGGLDPGTGSFPAGSNLEEVRQYLRAKAQALGINPDVAERVARSEGLTKTLGEGGDGGTSDGPYQLHVGGGLGDDYQKKYHHSIHDKRFWRDQVDFALEQAKQGGWGPWHGWHGPSRAGMGEAPDSTAFDDLKKKGWSVPDTSAGAGKADGSLPNVAGGSSYPGHITGQLKMGDEAYKFGSGGVRGASSIPFGNYPITPNAIGAWGRANGAIGINNDHIWDKSLGRMRDGIEMHVGHSFNLITEGCLAFEKEQFPKLKARINQMIQEHGHAYLHVGKDGASITPTPSLVDEARKARQGREEAARDGSIEAHVHIHDGQVRGASAKSSGSVKPPRVHLRRGPTMTEPSIST